AGRRGTPGYGASRPWMACGRALEPWTAESRDASYPRAAAAPSEDSALDAVAFTVFLATSLHSLPSQSPAPRTSPRYAIPSPRVPVMPEQNSILTPAQLNTLARDLLESAFPLVWVEGELGNVTRPASGHLYFNLKDARAQVRCAMFKPKSQW